MAQYDKAVTIKINGDNSNFKKAINDTSASIGSLKSVIAKLGLGAALYKGAAQAVQGFSSLESSIAKASTLFGETAVNTADLQDKILSLSNATALTADSIGNSLYNALSAGLPVTEDMGKSMEFLEKSAKLARAGFTDMDTAVSATAKIMNAYGMGVDKVDSIQNTLMATQNLGITTVNELGSTLATVTPVAAAFGVSIENVGSAVAVMTKAGTDTATATTQLAGLISELGKEGTTASKALASATKHSEKYKKAMTFKELIENGESLSDIMVLMQKEADRTGVSMVDLFSNIRAGKGALQIANDVETAAKFMETLRGEVNLVDDAYGKVTEAFAQQAEKMRNTFRNILSEVMSSSSGVLNELVSFANTSTQKLYDAFKKDGLKGLATSLLSQLEEQLKKFYKDAPKKLVEFTVIGLEMIEKISEGIAQKWPELEARFIEFLGNLVTNIADNMDRFMAIGKNIIVNLLNGAVGAFQQLATSFIRLSDMIAKIFLATDWISVGRDIIARIWNGIVKAFSKIKESIASLGRVIKDLIAGKSLAEAFQLEFSSSFEVGGSDGVINSLEELFDNITSAVGVVAADAGERAGQIYADNLAKVVEEEVKSLQVKAPETPAEGNVPGGSEETHSPETSTLDKLKEKWMSFIGVEEEAKKTGIEAVQAISDSLQSSLSALSGFYDQMYDNQISALEKARDAAKENGDLTVEEEKEMNEAINAIKKKQFDAEKRNNIARATISGAIAIMNIWKDWASNPAVAGTLTALASATLAMQLATIGSQQYQAFETGGIVQGRGITGDKNMIWANAGELILTRAQQANLASQLNNSRAGAIINVDFSGNVFGDRQSIAEYVYDAIMTAQNQGAIGAW